MSSSPTFLSTTIGLCATLSLFGCADYLTGQLEEPKGPIQVTKLTLFDTTSRDAPVFTDTSLPDCKTAPDCTKPENREQRICRVCYNDVFKDRYAPHKSPPNPDSGADIRVVFNKAALQLDGRELGTDFDPAKEASATDPAKALRDAVKLGCSECGGLPPFSRSLFVSGSDVSFDPTAIPYGPSIKLSASGDPRAALEPDSNYTVQVGSGIAGRDGEKWMATAEQSALLKFKTEPFKIARVFGSKNSPDKDEWVYKNEPALSSFEIADQPRGGAVTLVFNAPVHVASLASVMVDASKDGTTPIPVTLGGDAFGAAPGCKVKAQREVYVFPTSGDWPIDASEVKIRIPGGSIKDVAQGGAFGPGRHSITSELVLTVKFAASLGTPHVKNADARTASKCP